MAMKTNHGQGTAIKKYFQDVTDSFCGCWVLL
jgi:hypothetical protein